MPDSTSPLQPRPNDNQLATFDPPTPRIWLLVILTGIGAGLASGLAGT